MAIVRVDALRTINYAVITTSYQNLGSSVGQNWRMFRIINNTDGDMLISLDGTTNNLFLAANGFVLYDMASNALNVADSDWFVMQIGTQFQIKYKTAPTKGDVWLEAVYSKGV